jgi:hypothetical protein
LSSCPVGLCFSVEWVFSLSPLKPPCHRIITEVTWSTSHGLVHSWDDVRLNR